MITGNENLSPEALIERSLSRGDWGKENIQIPVLITTSHGQYITYS